MIPHSKPAFDETDAQAVANVVRSGFVVEGDKVRNLEGEIASLAGKKYGVAVSSGTAAIHLSLLSLNVGPGDFIALPSYTCSALLHAVGMTGAKPLLVDIDPFTFQIDKTDLEKKINKKTKAIIIPHPFGLPVDKEIFRYFDIPIIEDCAQAVGARYEKKQVGSLGDLSVFSFYATKVLAAGEGGIVCSDSETIISKIRDLREYDNKEDYTQRFNYKMTDIHAALGLSQLKRLDGFIERRREIAGLYDSCFSSLPILLPPKIPHRNSIYFRYIMQIPDNMNVEELISTMQKNGVCCMKPVFKPLHRLLNSDGFPSTEKVWMRSVSIPVYPGLSEEEIEIITSSIQRISWPGLGLGQK